MESLLSEVDLENDDIDPAPVLDKVKVACDEQGAKCFPRGDLGEGAPFHLTLPLVLLCLPR